MKLLKPEDIISVSFSIIIFLIQSYYLISKDLISFKDVIIIPGLLFLMLVIISLENKKKSAALKFIRSYYHIPYYAVVFSAFQTFVHKLNPNDWDKDLLKWDYIFFGFDATIWFEKFTTPWITEVLTIAYFSYYIVPSLTFIIFYFSLKRKVVADRYLLAIITGWYLAFIFYIIIPAAGPDIAFAEHYSVQLQGISYFSDYYLKTLGKYLRESNVRNTFPSMHFGIILISSYFAYRYKPYYFWFCLLPLGILLGIATIYLRQHYLIDLIASFPVAAISIYAGFKLKSQDTVNQTPICSSMS